MLSALKLTHILIRLAVDWCSKYEARDWELHLKREDLGCDAYIALDEDSELKRDEAAFAAEIESHPFLEFVSIVSQETGHDLLDLKIAAKKKFNGWPDLVTKLKELDAETFVELLRQLYDRWPEDAVRLFGPDVAATTAGAAAAGGFIERLLAGPDDKELTPTEFARLEAHLQQSVSVTANQLETRAAGESPTDVGRNKLQLIRDYNRNLHRETADYAAGTNDKKAKSQVATPTQKPKPGDLDTLLIAAITNHHKYDGDVCMAYEPITVRKLAADTRVSLGKVSNFFEHQFDSHAAYVDACRGPNLNHSMKMLNGELRPKLLWASHSADLDDRQKAD